MIASIADKDWKPPYEYANPTVHNVIKFWVETCRQAGAPTRINPYSQRVSAELLIAKFGYVETLRTLAWMGTPNSKYFQYGFSLRKVVQGHEELMEVQRTGVVKEHDGFIGPVGLKDLGR